MRKSLKHICLSLGVLSFLTFICVWIYAIWLDIDSSELALKTSATAIVVGFASICGYIFIHEQADDDRLREKNLSN